MASVVMYLLFMLIEIKIIAKILILLFYRFSYPLYLMRHLQQNLGPNVTLTILYDIACKLAAHIKVGFCIAIVHITNLFILFGFDVMTLFTFHHLMSFFFFFY
jgi:hypothetical protein